MTSLRNRYRRLVDDRAPTPAEATQDLEGILRRVRRRPPWWVVAPSLVGGVAAVGAALALWPRAQPPPPNPVPTEIRVHIPGEPEERALFLSITVNPGDTP